MFDLNENVLVVRYSGDFRQGEVSRRVCGRFKKNKISPQSMVDNYNFSLCLGETTFYFGSNGPLPTKAKLEEMFKGIDPIFDLQIQREGEVEE
jgi:hypothetical protein